MLKSFLVLFLSKKSRRTKQTGRSVNTDAVDNGRPYLSHWFKTRPRGQRQRAPDPGRCLRITCTGALHPHWPTPAAGAQLTTCTFIQMPLTLRQLGQIFHSVQFYCPSFSWGHISYQISWIFFFWTLNMRALFGLCAINLTFSLYKLHWKGWITGPVIQLI